MLLKLPIAQTKPFFWGLHNRASKKRLVPGQSLSVLGSLTLPSKNTKKATYETNDISQG